MTDDIVDVKGVVPQEPRERLKRIGVRFGSWGINVNFVNGTLELYRANRPDLAHLTVLWKTRSSEVDVHLTFGHEAAMLGSGPKLHEPLFRFRLEELDALGHGANVVAEQITRKHLLQHYKRFRPGWLARNGYMILVVERDVAFQWLKQTFPQKKRKFRLDPETAFKTENLPAEFLEEIYEPRVLHILRENGVRVGPMHDAEIAVQAVRYRSGNSAEDNIFLSYTLGPDGTVGWWGMTNRDGERLHRTLAARLFDWAVPLVQTGHVELFEKVVAGLGLEEDEDGRRFSENVRAFLRDPRNPFRQPYPGVRVP